MAFERRYVDRCVREGIDGFMQLLTTLVHEYVHSSASQDDHVHGYDFYACYEDVMTLPNLNAMDAALNGYNEFRRVCKRKKIDLDAVASTPLAPAPEAAPVDKEPALPLAAQAAPKTAAGPKPRRNRSKSKKAKSRGYVAMEQLPLDLFGSARMSGAPSRVQVGAALRRVREQAGVSQSEARRLVGVSRQTLFRWETGVSLPNVHQLLLLANCYGVPVNGMLPGAARSPLGVSEKASQ